MLTTLTAQLIAQLMMFAVQLYAFHQGYGLLVFAIGLCQLPFLVNAIRILRRPHAA